MKTFIRNTNMGLAIVNAIVNAKHDSPLRKAMIDRVQAVEKQATRTEHDGIRVSNMVLRKTGLAS